MELQVIPWTAGSATVTERDETVTFAECFPLTSTAEPAIARGTNDVRGSDTTTGEPNGMPQRSGAAIRIVTATGFAPALLLERLTVACGAVAVGSPTGWFEHGRRRRRGRDGRHEREGRENCKACRERLRITRIVSGGPLAATRFYRDLEVVRFVVQDARRGEPGQRAPGD